MDNVRRALPVIVALLVGGCAHGPAPAEPSKITEYLDPQTAMTVRVVAEPFVYGRDVPELAANARDYLSIGAVALDNMGQHRFFVALVSWSTIDRARSATATPSLPERLEWTVGSRSLERPVTSHHPRELGAGVSVLEPPVARIGDSWIEVKAEDIRGWADAPPEFVDVVVDGVRERYTLWRRADAALTEFAATLPADMPAARGRRRHVGL
jgi:hypothetical protein